MLTIKQIILWIFILQIAWTAAEKPRRLRHRNNTITKERLKQIKNAYSRLYKGQPATVNSMGLLIEQEDDEYYGLSAISYALNFSPYCFITDAYSLTTADDSPPPILYTDYFHTIFIYGRSCDVNYHYSEVFFNIIPPYNSTSYANDIAIVKTRGPVRYDTKCRNPGLEAAWITCSKDEIPTGYTDCFLASFGNREADETQAPEDIGINKLQMKMLSSGDCQKASGASDAAEFFDYYDSTINLCASTLDGLTGQCYYDENPFLFCKYWGKTNSNGWGSGSGWGSNNGWKSRSSGWTSDNKTQSNTNGWGWKPSTRQNLLAVGHWSTYFGESDCSSTDTGVNIFVKYASPAYRDLFSKCGYYCSSDLKPGYRCKGNPPKSLGPVYCFAEKIPNQGWSSDSHSSGWGPSD